MTIVGEALAEEVAVIVLLVLVAVVAISLVAYRSPRRHPTSVGGTARSTEHAGASAALDRWVDAGLIDRGQADEILAYEAASDAEAHAAQPAPRLSPALEALSYVGGVLLVVGAGMLVAQFWPEVGTVGRVAILLLASVATLLVGLVVGERDGLTWRLRGFLWALSTGAAAATVGVAAYDVFDVRDRPLGVAVALTGAVHAGLCWQRRERPLQLLLTFVGIAATVGFAMAWAGDDGVATGALLWALGAAWAWLAWRALAPPAAVSLVLGAALTLVACGIVGSQIEWLAPLLGLATAMLWVGVGIATNEPLALAPGVVGIFVYLPWTLGYFFGETLGAPAVAMGSGLALLVVVALLVRRGRHDGGTDGSSGSRHRLPHLPGPPWAQTTT